ncbi:MAG: ROK family protein [Rhodothermaceae bacterium]|nr:ROK family protein [Rhodothermaceae bacterium]
MYGGIEAGGTKFVCAVGTGPDDLSEMVRFPTTTPEETIGKVIAYFKNQPHSLKGIGIASFGPIDPNPSSESFGYITSTPKLLWQQTDLVGPIKKAFDVPVGFDTDVNGAALSEVRWGAAQDVASSVYFTVGTGIGGGAVVNGKTINGLLHPEMGHMRIPRVEGDDFKGHCPFHGPCLEGMATGPALKARWGMPAETLPEDHIAWDYEAHYLAMAVVNTILVLSPERIIMGGGVMDQKQLFPKIRARVQKALNGYVDSEVITKNINRYIVPPGLGNRAGVLGAILLGELAAG